MKGPDPGKNTNLAVQDLIGLLINRSSRLPRGFECAARMQNSMEARAPPLESLSLHRKQLHAHLLRRGYPFPPTEYPEPDRAYLSVLRAAFATPVLALTACLCLRRAGLPAPGRRALPALLRPATRTRCADSVGSVHGLAVRVGVEDDGFVGTALVGAYVACRRVADARRMFDGMLDRDVVAWGVMIDR